MYLPAGQFLPYRSSRLHYYCWGAGPRLLFAFHGYSESASSFALIGEAIDTPFTLIAIDLPFHGQTEWKEGLSFAPDELDVPAAKIYQTELTERVAAFMGKPRA